MRRSFETSAPRLRAHPDHGALLLLPLLGTLLLVLLAVGYLVAHSRGLILMALFVGLPVLIVALRAFEELVVALPFVALLVRYSLPTGSDSRVSAVMLLVLLLSAIWLVVVISRRRLNLVRSPLNGPLLTFSAITVVALVWSIAFRDPLLIHYNRFALVQLGACAALVLSPVATLLIANFVGTTARLRLIGLSFVAVGTLSTVAYVVGLKLPELNTGGLFALWFVAVGAAIVLYQPGVPLVMRLGLSLVLMLQIYDRAIVGIAWLSGWVPALVALALIVWLRSRLAAVALLLLLLLISVWQRPFIQKNIFDEAEHDGSYERLTLWQLSWELVGEHPLVGTGPAGYALYYMTYHPEEARSTHNNYIDIVAQTGILGGLCWLWLVLATMREARAVLRHAPPGWLRTLGIAAISGLCGALVAMALGDWVLPFAYNQGIEGYRYTVFSWMFLGMLISIRHLVAPQPAARTATTPSSRTLIEQRPIDRCERSGAA